MMRQSLPCRRPEARPYSRLEIGIWTAAGCSVFESAFCPPHFAPGSAASGRMAPEERFGAFNRPVFGIVVVEGAMMITGSVGRVLRQICCNSGPYRHARRRSGNWPTPANWI